MRARESELTHLKHELALADVTLDAERARGASLELRVALRERELELRALRAGAPAPSDSARETVTVSETEDDARGVESSSRIERYGAETDAFFEELANETHAELARSRRAFDFMAPEYAGVRARALEKALTVTVRPPGVNARFNPLGRKTRRRMYRALARRVEASRADARAVRAGDVEGSPGSKGKLQCQKCERHVGANLTNNGVRVVVCFAAPHDSTCIACKELKRDTNSARPNVQSTGSPVATTSGRMQTMMVRPAARKNASNAASPMLSPAPSRKRKMYEEELRDAYVVMHSAADKGDIARCDELRQIFIKDKDKFDNPCVWHHELISCVARDGRRPIEVIEWAMSHGAKLTKAAAKRAVERTRHKSREYQGRYTSALDLLKFIHSCSPKVIDDETMFCVCEFGEMECLRWIIENVDGCEVRTWQNGLTPRGTPNELMLIAAQNGHVDILKYLYDCDCDWTADDAKEAIGFVMNAEPSSPLNWHEVVLFIQSTFEWRAENQPPRVF